LNKFVLLAVFLGISSLPASANWTLSKSDMGLLQYLKNGWTVVETVSPGILLITDDAEFALCVVNVSTGNFETILGTRDDDKFKTVNTDCANLTEQ